MISFPSLVTSDPAEFLSLVRADVKWPPAVGRVGGFGGGWDADWFPGLEFCRSFPDPTRISAEKQKLFTRDTARNYRAKLTSCRGEQQDPTRSRGTRKTSSTRAGEGEGRGRQLRAWDSGRPARPDTRRRPNLAGGGRRRRRGAGRASAALGRHLLLAAAPGAGRRGYCLDSACRALRLRRRRGRPELEPRGRTGSMAAPSPGRPSGRPSFRPSLPAFPSRPRALFSSLSRFPAAVPSLPSSFFFPGGGSSPGKRRGWGQAAASSPHELAGPRQGPRLRPAPPRHIHSSERLRGAGRGGRERRERRRKGAGAERSYRLTGRGGNSATAPRGRGEEAARGGGSAAGAGAGRPPAGFAPTANSWAGGRREPVTARGGGAGRRRWGGWGCGPGAAGRGPGGGAGGGQGFACEARHEARSGPGLGGLLAASRLPKVGDSDEADPG